MDNTVRQYMKKWRADADKKIKQGIQGQSSASSTAPNVGSQNPFPTTPKQRGKQASTSVSWETSNDSVINKLLGDSHHPHGDELSDGSLEVDQQWPQHQQLTDQQNKAYSVRSSLCDISEGLSLSRPYNRKSFVSPLQSTLRKTYQASRPSNNRNTKFQYSMGLQPIEQLRSLNMMNTDSSNLSAMQTDRSSFLQVPSRHSISSQRLELLTSKYPTHTMEPPYALHPPSRGTSSGTATALPQLDNAGFPSPIQANVEQQLDPFAKASNIRNKASPQSSSAPKPLAPKGRVGQERSPASKSLQPYKGPNFLLLTDPSSKSTNKRNIVTPPSSSVPKPLAPKGRVGQERPSSSKSLQTSKGQNFPLLTDPSAEASNTRNKVSTPPSSVSEPSAAKGCVGHERTAASKSLQTSKGPNLPILTDPSAKASNIRNKVSPPSSSVPKPLAPKGRVGQERHSTSKSLETSKRPNFSVLTDLSAKAKHIKNEDLAPSSSISKFLAPSEQKIRKRSLDSKSFEISKMSKIPRLADTNVGKTAELAFKGSIGYSSSCEGIITIKIKEEPMVFPFIDFETVQWLITQIREESGEDLPCRILNYAGARYSKHVRLANVRPPFTVIVGNVKTLITDISKLVEQTSIEHLIKKLLANQQQASAFHPTASTTWQMGDIKSRSKYEGQSQQSGMLADVGDIKKEMDVDKKGYDCKSTDFTTTENHDSKRGIDFFLNHQKIKISKSIPNEILDSLEMLCEKYSVKFATFAQDPDDWQHILILGDNAQNIPKEEVAIPIENTPFKVTQQNSNGPLHTELCSLSIKKKTWTNNSWTPEEAASCELLVSAQERNRDKPRNGGSSYSIGPAHMILRDETARSLFAQPNRVQDARIEVESQSTTNRYLIQVDDVETDIFDLNHPVLLSYRYWCSTNPQCDSCIDLDGGAGDVDDIRLCRHMIINDIVFLPLERPSADRLQNQLNHLFNFEIGQVVSINTIGQLRNLGERNLPIKVGNAEGYLVPYMPAVRNRRSFIGYHLQFILHSKSEEGNDHTLGAGDCGRIVFCEGGNRNQYHPLGMFFGRFKGSSSFQTPVYQAILLKEAFNDIELEYPHHVRKVNLYKHRQTYM